MSIHFSSEADFCLLCSQLCLLTIFCLPEKNENWGQSEKWGEGRQRRPNLKLQGGIIESLKCNKKCVPKTSLKHTVLVRGADSTLPPAHCTFWGRVSGWEPPPGVSPLAPSVDPCPPQALLRPLCFASRRPVSCPPLFSYPLSFLDSLGCYRPGWRHRHHKTFPQPVSCPRPALLL